jgi:hypothetical protein
MPAIRPGLTCARNFGVTSTQQRFRPSSLLGRAEEASSFRTRLWTSQQGMRRAPENQCVGVSSHCQPRFHDSHRWKPNSTVSFLGENVSFYRRNVIPKIKCSWRWGQSQEHEGALHLTSWRGRARLLRSTTQAAPQSRPSRPYPVE